MKEYFPHSFEWQILGGLPANKNIVNFPPGVREYSEEYVIEVNPANKKPWVGNFHGIGIEYQSGVYTTPEINTICIVSGGLGYLVNAFSPSDFQKIPIKPVIEVRSLILQGLLILIDYSSIAAIDKNGIRWTIDVSSDGLKISDITEEKMDVLAWNPAKGSNVKFEIDLISGKCVDGSYS